MICQIENGRSVPTLATAERIAAGCGASLADFLQRDAADSPTSLEIERTIPAEGTHAGSNKIVHHR